MQTTNTTTRRNLLAGGTAVIVAGSVPALSDEHSDAELQGLGRQWRSARDEWTRAVEAHPAPQKARAIERLRRGGNGDSAERLARMVGDVDMRASDRMHELEQAIAEVQATTLAGLAVKARATLYRDWHDFGIGDQPRGLAHDVLALAEGGQS